MTTEIIILIIGALFLLPVIGGSIFGKEPSSSKLRVPLTIIGVLLIIYGGYFYGSVNTLGSIEQPDIGNKLAVKYPVEEVQVISPVEGDKVKCRILTMGVYPNSHDKDIWVVLRPSDNRYYPQSDHTNTSFKRNGEWQVITRFGGDQDESYEVIVYETDASTSEFFSTTIQGWKDMGSYPGLEQTDIPTGAKEVDRIVVSLQENCRGVF